MVACMRKESLAHIVKTAVRSSSSSSRSYGNFWALSLCLVLTAPKVPL